MHLNTLVQVLDYVQQQVHKCTNVNVRYINVFVPSNIQKHTNVNVLGLHVTMISLCMLYVL